MSDIFSDNLKRLEDVKKITGFSEAETSLLSSHKQVNQTELEVDGQKYPAWRIIHNNALGPGKGGIRFHSQVNEDEVKSLSFWMSLKNSLSGLPYGGAKGGVKIDAKNASPELLEKVSRAYMGAFHQVVGQDKDILAPDAYTNPQIMAWMLDEYEKITGHSEPGMLTGKPVELGGHPMREDATARGGFIIIREMVQHFGFEKTKGLTVAVQGFGNAGALLAQMLHHDGFKIVAVSDSQGGIYNPEGLDVEMVMRKKKEHGSVIGYNEQKQISNDQLLEMDADILVLAALENQITADNADKIKAKYIVELANGPVSYDADRILNQKGTIVMPDILTNAGGVIVSYFEWTQNLNGQILDLSYFEKKLPEILENAWHKVYNLYQEKNGAIDLRLSAYIIAMERILKAERLRGNLN